jgi:hypothetical protein
MTIEGRPVLSDKTYKKYVLEHLENWVHDAITTDEVTAQEVYDVIVKCIEVNVKYHKDNFDKNTELLSLMKGHRSTYLDEYYDGWDSMDSKEPIVLQYTEEEMNAMCERAATENDKETCREYNLREAEYYNKRAQLDAEHDQKKTKYL